jgi:adenylosuccinate synthase
LIRSENSLRIVVLSGPVSAGKSTLANLLRDRYGAHVVRTREFIKQRHPRVKDERRALQRAGERLDGADNGAWVREGLVRVIEAAQTGATPTGMFVVDSVRIPGQIEAIRQAYGPAVHHVHLYAEDDELRQRYAQKGKRTRELPEYREVQKNKTERGIVALAKLADLVVATDRCSPEAVLVRATALLGLYSRNRTPLVDVLVGGQYGSEGKGNIVGYIAPEYQLLVRVGGPNAGHQVYREPTPEVYHHLPSGTGRAPHAKLLISAGAVLYPKGLLSEITEHNVEADRLSIHPQAMIIEDADRESEALILASIGSTGQGVGAASARKIMGRGGMINPAVRLAKDVPELRPYIRDTQEILERAFVQGCPVLLEGTQGTALSLHHGDYPHVTSRDTTVAGCLADAGIAVTRVRRVVMVCRTYPIRVADPAIEGETSGPMASPISYQELANRSGIGIDELLKIETTTTTKRQRRVANFDWEQLRRSTFLNGPTDIALTFVDYLDLRNRSAFRFEQLTSETLRFVEEVERITGVTVSLISTNFSWRNVIDRRAW